MITNHDLQEAISECLGKRHPDASTCIKLAAFYTIRNELYGAEAKEQEQPPTYSFSGPQNATESLVDYYKDTDLSRMIDGRNQSDVWPIIDELVEAVQVMNPRLYNNFMGRLQQL